MGENNDFGCYLPPANCSDEKTCNNHGNCRIDGSCLCYSEYYGDYCESELVRDGSVDDTGLVFIILFGMIGLPCVTFLCFHYCTKEDSPCKFPGHGNFGAFQSGNSSGFGRVGQPSANPNPSANNSRAIALAEAQKPVFQVQMQTNTQPSSGTALTNHQQEQLDMFQATFPVKTRDEAIQLLKRNDWDANRAAESQLG